ncbi:MAG: alpha/beta fold hydrolase [Bacteriovoracaceae bacterium]|nr:alpha/beta fold hydrolase [Bacteriovoracaceae bacterium]
MKIVFLITILSAVSILPVWSQTGRLNLCADDAKKLLSQGPSTRPFSVRLRSTGEVPFLLWKKQVKDYKTSLRRGRQTSTAGNSQKQLQIYTRQFGKPDNSMDRFGNLTHLKSKTGTLETIVIAHGMGTSNRLLPMAQALSDKYNVVLFTRQSPPSANTSTWAYAQDIAFLMDSLGYDKFTVLGHSYGGKIAMRTASLFPHKVKRVILEDAVLNGSTPQDRSFKVSYIAEKITDIFSTSPVAVMEIRRAYQVKNPKPTGKSWYSFDKTFSYPVFEMDINQHFMHEYQTDPVVSTINQFMSMTTP